MMRGREAGTHTMLHLITRSAKIFTLVVLSSAFALAQQTPSSTASQPPSNQIQPQSSAPANGFSHPTAASPQSNIGLAQTGLLTPIYGLQGVLAETVDGATVAAQSIDEKFNPASSIKLAT